MYASISEAQVKPGQIDECLRIWNESIRPELAALPGYIVAYVLVDRTSHEVMTVALYETEADAERTQSSGRYRELVAHLVPVMVPGSLERKGFEVGIEARRA
jgi:heme-degrading monooxygenase HmoA